MFFFGKTDRSPRNFDRVDGGEPNVAGNAEFLPRKTGIMGIGGRPSQRLILNSNSIVSAEKTNKKRDKSESKRALFGEATSA
jgi:hypothetical protein